MSHEDSRNGLSPAAQREGIESYVRQAGLPELEIYEEPRAFSGDTPLEKRGAGRRLAADIIAGRIHAVVARDQDRYFRDTLAWLNFEKFCRKYDVEIHTFSGLSRTDQPEERLSTTVQAAVGEYERRKTGQRVSRVKRAMAQAGRHLGGPPPFGYTSQSRIAAELRAEGMSADSARIESEARLLHSKQLFIDAAEASIVKLMFQLYVTKHWGCRRICNHLNTLGHRRRTGLLWHPDKVRRVLSDPVVCGLIPYDEVKFTQKSAPNTPRSQQMLHPGKHEPIISEDIWRRAQIIKTRNTCVHLGKGDSSYVQRRYPLSGVLQCRCGSKMHSRSAGHGRTHAYYLCVKRKYFGDNPAAGGCSFARLNVAKVHQTFWSRISELLSDADVISHVYSRAHAILQQSAMREAEEASAGREVGQLRKQLEVWTRRLADIDADRESEALTHIQELKAKLRAMKATTPPPTDVPVTAISIERVREYLESLSSLIEGAEDQGKALVHSLVEHHGLTVDVIDDVTLRVRLNLRPPGATDASGEFCVPLEVDARLPSDKITAWVNAQLNTKKCACGCGQFVDVRRKHYWMGVPEFRSTCRHKGMSRRRWQLAKGLYTGQKVATMLGIGRTTVNRWVKSGKLPTPTRSISNMLLFDVTAIDALVAASRA